MLVAFLAVGIWSPNLDAHVSYATRAARAAVVVPELGRLAGVNLQVSPQTANEVLIVSVKDVPLSEILPRIATVTDGAWKQEGNTLRLVPDQTVRRKEERDIAAKNVAAVKKLIANRQAAEKKLEAEALKPKTQKEGEETDDGDGPTRLLNNSTITELLAGIDPSQLAAIRPNERIVFSTDPTRTQSRLGSNAEGVIANFIQRHNDLLAARPPITDDGDVTGMSRDDIRMMKAFMARETHKIGPITKALFIVEQPLADYQGGSNGDEGGDSGAALVLYNAQGGIAYSIQGSPDPYPSDDTPADHGATAGGDYSPAATVPRSPIARIRPQTTEGFATKIYLPLKYDPLSFFQSDDLIEYETSKGKPFVADVPDDWEANTLMIGKESGPRVRVVEESLKQRDSIASVDDGLFTLVKPANPVESRRIRLDRTPLQKLMQAVTAKGIPSIDDFAAFALDQPDCDDPLAVLFLANFIPGGATYLGGHEVWSMLRFYGRLDSEQRNSLFQNGSLSISKLTADQKAELAQILYQSPNPLVLDDANHHADPEDKFIDAGLFDPDADYRVEPTEVAAGGLPDVGLIELAQTSAPVAIRLETRRGMPSKYWRIYEPTVLANYRVSREQRAKSGTRPAPDLGKFRLGITTRLTFTVRIAPQSVFRFPIFDQRLTDDPTEVTESTLPPGFEKLVAQKEAELKKAMEAQGSGDGGPQKIHP